MACHVPNVLFLWSGCGVCVVCFSPCLDNFYLKHNSITIPQSFMLNNNNNINIQCWHDPIWNPTTNNNNVGVILFGSQHQTTTNDNMNMFWFITNNNTYIQCWHGSLEPQQHNNRPWWPPSPTRHDTPCLSLYSIFVLCVCVYSDDQSKWTFSFSFWLFTHAFPVSLLLADAIVCVSAFLFL